MLWHDFLGVISDTHGLLRREALDALRGSELIIHAGDVGKPEILERLREIAPVVAVRGNVDTAPWAEALPETQVVRVVGRPASTSCMIDPILWPILSPPAMRPSCSAIHTRP